MTKQPEATKAAVVLVEDHPMFRERLAELINKEPGAQVAIIDISLQGASGLELLKNLKAASVTIPVLILSMHDESLYAERALRAGARGYITKNEASAKVMTALRQVLAGEIYVGTKAATRILANLSHASQGRSGMERLTDRELEVFEKIGRGRTTREIGIQLGVGAATVETHRSRIKEKLQLENGAQLQREALRWVQATETVEA